MDHRNRNYIAAGAVGVGVVFFGVLFNIAKTQQPIVGRDAYTIVRDNINSTLKDFSDWRENLNNYPPEYWHTLGYLSLIAGVSIAILLALQLARRR